MRPDRRAELADPDSSGQDSHVRRFVNVGQASQIPARHRHTAGTMSEPRGQTSVKAVPVLAGVGINIVTRARVGLIRDPRGHCGPDPQYTHSAGQDPDATNVHLPAIPHCDHQRGKKVKALCHCFALQVLESERENSRQIL